MRQRASCFPVALQGTAFTSLSPLVFTRSFIKTFHRSYEIPSWLFYATNSIGELSKQGGLQCYVACYISLQHRSLLSIFALLHFVMVSVNV